MAATYYASPTGSDGNPGTETHPWLTINHAKEIATAGDAVLFADGTYHVEGADNYGCVFRNSGLPGAPITFKAVNSRQAVLDCTGLHDALWIKSPWIRIEGFDVSGCDHYAAVLIEEHIVVSDCAFHDCGDDIIKVLPEGAHCEIVDCLFYGPQRANCIDAFGPYTDIHHCRFEDTYSIRDSGQDQVILIKGGSHHSRVHHCVFADSGVGGYAGWTGAVICVGGWCGTGKVETYGEGFECEDTLVYNNIIAHPEYPAIKFWEARNCAAFNNTIIEPKRWAFAVHGNIHGFGGVLIDNSGSRFTRHDSKDNTIANNLVLATQPLARDELLRVAYANEEGFSCHHNLWYRPEGNQNWVGWLIRNEAPWWHNTPITHAEWTSVTTHGGGDVLDDPKFVNLIDGNLHLQPDSPAIDFGFILPGVPDDDFDGNPRPVGVTVDIGAYEYQGGGGAANNPPVLQWAGPPDHNESGFAPLAGTVETDFSFKIKYSDADGDEPSTGVRLYLKKNGDVVEGGPFEMAKEDPGASDWVSGVIFAYDSTGLSKGDAESYSLFFTADDGKAAAVGAGADETVGPNVSNTPPTQGTVEITPEEPDLADDLVANAGGSTDADGDGITYQYQWYKNDDLQADLTTDTVPSSRTSVRDRWRVVVTPNDGEDDGPSCEDSVTLGNTPPTEPDVTIAPANPKTEDGLVATADGSTDADGDPITYQYEWYKDDALQDGLTTDTVSCDLTGKGEVWRVVVTPNDGTEDGPSGDAEGTIDNTAPTAPTVAITPASPNANDDLVATADGSTDADGDTITYQYEWRKDGVLQNGLTTDTVSSNLTSVGEQWRVVVTPNDGTEDGPSGDAEGTIDNTAPTKPTVTISPENPKTGDDLVAAANGSTDPDGDTLTYSYDWYKNGTHQSDLTGDVVSADLTQKGENWRVVVRAHDGTEYGPSGKANVKVKNSKPTAPAVDVSPNSPKTDDDLVATADGSTDQDGDDIAYQYKWYRNGRVQSGLTTATVPSARTSEDQTWRVVVTAHDGTASGPAGEDSVSLGNTPPTAPTVAISPDRPKAGDDVVANADGSTDADGDSITYRYTWYKNGAWQRSLRKATVPGRRVHEGDWWRVIVRAHDGTQYSRSTKASVRVNVPPGAPAVSISPSRPRTGASLVARARRSKDADGDKPTFRYTWYKDGVWQRDLTGDMVPRHVTKSGDWWRVIVRAHDGVEFGPATKADTTINTPPTAPTVSIAPASPTAGDDLIAIADGSTDTDGDSIRYDYVWYKDGVWQRDQAGDTVSADLTRAGDWWRVIVRAHDGVEYGRAAKGNVTVRAGDVGSEACRVFERKLHEGINLIGVPCFSAAIHPTDGSDTVTLARWDAKMGRYDVAAGPEVGSDAPRLQPGQGFFVDIRDGDLRVAGRPVSVEEPFTLDLEHGWNLVANMFATSLPFGNMVSGNASPVDPYCYAFDAATGSYVLISEAPGVDIDRTEVRSWEGIWVYNGGAATSMEIAPPVEALAAAAAGPRALELGAGAWTVRVVARAGNRQDTTTTLGVAPGLGRAIEIANPPAAPRTVDVYLTGATGRGLAQDIRAGAACAQSWTFAVATDLPSADVEVSLPDLSQVPNDLAVYLTDLETGKRVYARTMGQYAFTSGEAGGKRMFRMDVAPRSEAGLVISSAAASSGAGCVVVTYATSCECRVKARVTNIAGRTIRTLSESAPASRGLNTVAWNLRSASGTAVPNGRYLIQIEAVGDDGQRAQAITSAVVRR